MLCASWPRFPTLGTCFVDARTRSIEVAPELVSSKHHRHAAGEEQDGPEVIGLIKRVEKRVRHSVDLSEKARNMMGMLDLLEAG